MAPLKSPHDRAAALLRERVRRLFREFPGALAGEEEPVHQVRVAARRLRVALPLLARRSGGRRLKKTRRILRDLTRAAGTGRDLDVQVALFEERLASLPRVSTGQKELLRRLRAARTRSRGRLAGGILDLDIDGLRRHIRRLRSRGPAEAEVILERTRSEREREGAALMEGLAVVGDDYDPEALHALRRRVRRLRYTAEVDDVVSGQDSGAVSAWKKLQEAIGGLHDAHVLSVWFGRLAERASARGQRALAAAARGESRVFEAEARRRHRRLLKARPAEMAAQTLHVEPHRGPSPGNGKKASSAWSSSSSAARSPFRAGPRALPTPSAL